jgi:predicted nucleotidyltransferase
MAERVELLLRQLRGELEAIYGPRLRGVYLFGSRARGEAAADSDVDVLVVLDQLDRYGVEIDRTGEVASRLSIETGLSVSRVFVTEREWRESRSPFLLNVREEAVCA